MPKITIVENDLTGVSYTGDETVVYVPGSVPFVDDITADSNNCYLIQPSADLSNILDGSSLPSVATNAPGENITVKTILYIDSLLNKGFYVLYNYIASFDGSAETVNYLKDKNMYNVKYLTCGINPTLTLTKGETTSITSGFASSLYTVAESRQDCVVLVDVAGCTDPDNDDYVATVADIKTILDSATSSILGTYAACFYPNGVHTLTSSVSYKDKLALTDIECVMPASFGYLLCAGNAIKLNKKWDAVAGVVRGGLPSTFARNSITLSKYDLDTDVLDSEKGGVCFNGIVDIKPYGYTIWGDRTLVKNSAGISGLKASSFLSTRLMLCDIKKRVYTAAIQNTYETNNDITWMNFKNQIASLLSQMSADGKLESYKIIKMPSAYMSQMSCKIKLVPNMPVEDFYVYITLENAEAEVTEG